VPHLKAEGRTMLPGSKRTPCLTLPDRLRRDATVDDIGKASVQAVRARGTRARPQMVPRTSHMATPGVFGGVSQTPDCRHLVGRAMFVVV